jgi:hypothetical protein
LAVVVDCATDIVVYISVIIDYAEFEIVQDTIVDNVPVATVTEGAIVINLAAEISPGVMTYVD